MAAAARAGGVDRGAALSTRLRPAVPADIADLVAIRDALPLRGASAAPRGGFLLGCSPERYALLIEAADVLVLELGATVAGYLIMSFLVNKVGVKL